jgi:hypothetical protein
MIDLDDRLNMLIAADERGRSDITNVARAASITAW